MLTFLDHTGEFLAAVLRGGNAGSNIAADHITVLDQALTQIPDQHCHGAPSLIRADTAGCTKDFLAHVRGLREKGMSCSFSIGWAITERERAAISALPNTVWADAIDTNGRPRDGAALAELTGVLPARALASYPTGTRVIVRRERPHPGAQLDAFKSAMAGATPPSSPTPRVGNSPHSTRTTVPTPASRTASAPPRTPD